MTDLKKVDLDSNADSEQEDALEYYMMRCLRLEAQIELLKERVKALEDKE
jgi:hypothetical protein